MTHAKKLTAMAAILALYPTIALAEVTVGALMGTEEAQIRASLEAAGYSVKEIEIEDGEIEAEVMLDGKTLEVEISPEDGTVLALETDEDDDGDDGEDDDDDAGKGGEDDDSNTGSDNG